MVASGQADRPYYPQDYPQQLRASDQHREIVAEVVRGAVSDGRISVSEMDSRIQQVYEARTHGDLTHVISDLVIYQPPRPGPAPPARYAPPVSDRKILIGFLLCFFFGVLGFHRFYAGKIGSGIAMVLITVLTIGFGVVVTGVWALVDLIVLAAGGFRDGDARRMRDWV